MKKKNGFTLVELMATIAILVLMSVIIGTNIVSILKSTEENEKENTKKELEKAACVYIESSLNTTECNSTCKISVQKLIESGLIDDSYTNIKEDKITIKWISDGEKICIYEK